MDLLHNVRRLLELAGSNWSDRIIGFAARHDVSKIRRRHFVRHAIELRYRSTSNTHGSFWLLSTSTSDCVSGVNEWAPANFIQEAELVWL